MAKAVGKSGSREMLFEPYLGGFILETLTLGMYGEAQNAIREYLQNSFDAVLTAGKKGLIEPTDGIVEVTMSEQLLVLRDNGTGIKKNIAVETLTSIGASRKDYRTEAGFRGIGRLAGIAFCNVLRFRTKAAGEEIETEVAFDAQGLRKDMAPASGGQMTLTELLEAHVKATQTPAEADDPGFFEVSLEGFDNPPIECVDASSMRTFISQVAPVPYAADFPFLSRLEAESAKSSIEIDTVRVVVIADDVEVEVFKAYGPQVTVGKNAVNINRCEIFQSPTKRWWGWVGHKASPGVIRDDATKGVRVRVRNIQIDGTQIFGRLFDKIPTARSYRRFNEWYVGEIFIDPTALVPNARRDGFEDDKSWRDVQKELVDICAKLGAEGYKISSQHQSSLKVLAQGVRDIETDLKTLLAADPADTDKIMALSTKVNKIHRTVTRAIKSADFEISGQLRSLENKLLDAKARAIRKLGVVQMQDMEEIREDAQSELVAELMTAFKEQLEMKCYRQVRKIVKAVVGYEAT
jgi:hypothetical protein